MARFVSESEFDDLLISKGPKAAIGIDDASDDDLLAEAQDIGTFIGDKRVMTDKHKLQLLRNEMRDPDRNPDSTPELEGEIRNLERKLGAKAPGQPSAFASAAPAYEVKPQRVALSLDDFADDDDPVIRLSRGESPYKPEPTEAKRDAKKGPEGSGVMRRVFGDTGVDLAKGVVDLGQSAVGLGDLVTGGYAGKALEYIGYDPKRTQDTLAELYSPERAKANANVQAAKGFVEMAGALLTNPSVIVGGAAESLPSMIGIVGGGRALAVKIFQRAGGGEAGAAAVKAAMPKIIAAGAASEGALSAGDIAEQARQAGREWKDYILPSLASGATTAGISMLSGKLGNTRIGQKLGLGDAEAKLATAGLNEASGRAAGSRVGQVLKQGVGGVVSEGALEEMPQSATEQAFGNIAQGKDVEEGVPEASAQGLLVGGAMGGAMKGGHALLAPGEAEAPAAAPAAGAAPGAAAAPPGGAPPGAPPITTAPPVGAPAAPPEEPLIDPATGEPVKPVETKTPDELRKMADDQISEWAARGRKEPVVGQDDQGTVIEHPEPLDENERNALNNLRTWVRNGDMENIAKFFEVNLAGGPAGAAASPTAAPAAVAPEAPAAPAAPAAAEPPADASWDDMADYATPKARADLKAAGIDPLDVTATGPRGKITEADVQRSVQAKTTAQLRGAKAGATAAPADAVGETAGPTADDVAAADAILSGTGTTRTATESLPDTDTPTSFEVRGNKYTGTQIGKRTLSKLQRFAKLFGKTLVLYDNAPGEWAGDGFFHPESSKHIFLSSVTQAAPHMVVFGHELMHALEKDLPLAFARLKKAIIKAAKPDAIERMKKQYTGTLDTDDAVWNEIVSDMGGNRLAEVETWKKIFKSLENHGLVMRVANYVRDMIGNAINFAKRQTGFVTDDYIKDLEGVRNAVATATVSYIRDVQKKATPAPAKKVVNAQAQPQPPPTPPPTAPPAAPAGPQAKAPLSVVPPAAPPATPAPQPTEVQPAQAAPAPVAPAKPKLTPAAAKVLIGKLLDKGRAKEVRAAWNDREELMRIVADMEDDKRVKTKQALEQMRQRIEDLAPIQPAKAPTVEKFLEDYGAKAVWDDPEALAAQLAGMEEDIDVGAVPAWLGNLTEAARQVEERITQLEGMSIAESPEPLAKAIRKEVGIAEPTQFPESPTEVAKKVKAAQKTLKLPLIKTSIPKKGSEAAEALWTLDMSYGDRVGKALGYVKTKDGSDLVRFEDIDGTKLDVPPHSMFPSQPDGTPDVAVPAETEATPVPEQSLYSVWEAAEQGDEKAQAELDKRTTPLADDKDEVKLQKMMERREYLDHQLMSKLSKKKAEKLQAERNQLAEDIHMLTYRSPSENKSEKYEPAAAENAKPSKGKLIVEGAKDLVITEKEFTKIVDTFEEVIVNPSNQVSMEKKLGKNFVSVKVANATIASWKKHAKSQRGNSNRTVLSFFDLTGEWAKPWFDAGYNVITFDLQSGQNVLDFSADYFVENWDISDVYAILSAVPCTRFSAAGNRHRAAHKEGGDSKDMKLAKELAWQTMRTIEFFRPAIWAIENPVGTIQSEVGLPNWRLAFHPHHFGPTPDQKNLPEAYRDHGGGYTKKTLLWGNFDPNLPTANVPGYWNWDKNEGDVGPDGTKGMGSIMQRLYGGGSEKTKNARSITPEGFAYAFFMANNYNDLSPEKRLIADYPEISNAVIGATQAGFTEKQIRDIVDEPYGNYEREDAADELLQAVKDAKKKPAVKAAIKASKPVKKKGAKKSELRATDILATGDAVKNIMRQALESPSVHQDDLSDEHMSRYGIRPYSSPGQLEIPFDQLPSYSAIRRNVQKMPFGLERNENGTVTLYQPSSNAHARQSVRDKVLRGVTPDATRIQLTTKPRTGEADVLVQVDPSMLHLDFEHPDGRKDFFIPIMEGEAFNKRMKRMQLFTLNAPRTTPISADVTIGKMGASIERAVAAIKAMTPAEKKANLARARKILKAEHNVGTLLGENGKLEKTRINELQLTYEGQPVASLGLGMASAQQLNAEKLTTCIMSARCELLCLGETSGQNELYGGEGAARSGPRLSQFLKTEALVLHPEEFAAVMIAEIESFNRWSAKPTEGKKTGGKMTQVPKDIYKPAIRLNVTTDFPAKMWAPLINAFPGTMFYDYTKLENQKSIAPNHHITFSSSGAAQVVNGTPVAGRGNNWKTMIGKLRAGYNVAMAFDNKDAIPAFIKDEVSGETFQVWDGDNYDARFLDPKRPDGIGVIVGLTNKDRTGSAENATVAHDGFFVHFDPKDGDTVVIGDQQKIAAQAAQAVELEKRTSEKLDREALNYWEGEGGPTAATPAAQASNVQPLQFMRRVPPTQDVEESEGYRPPRAAQQPAAMQAGPKRSSLRKVEYFVGENGPRLSGPKISMRNTQLSPAQLAGPRAVSYTHELYIGDDHVGELTLGWRGKEITSLPWVVIYDKYRGQGLGEELLKDLLTHNGNRLILVQYITARAREFWRKMGADIFPGEGGGIYGDLTAARFDLARGTSISQRPANERAGEVRAEAGPGERGEPTGTAVAGADQGEPGEVRGGGPEGPLEGDALDLDFTRKSSALRQPRAGAFTLPTGDGIVYHVTKTSSAAKIGKQGFVLMKPSNWERQGGGAYQEPAIFAFEDLGDAVRWAGRMDWAQNKDTGSGKISVVAVRNDGKWGVDKNDPLSQSGAKGRWLKRETPPAAKDVIAAQPATLADMRKLVADQDAEAEELEPQRSALRVDNPGGDWLRREREDAAAAGRGEFGEPKRFGALTGTYNDLVTLPVDLAASFKGMRGEQSRVRERSIDYLSKAMAGGELPKRDGRELAPFIMVDQKGEPWVNEGNHRIMVAKKLGWDTIPAEVRYFSGGEDADGPLHPDKIAEMAEAQPQFSSMRWTPDDEGVLRRPEPPRLSASDVQATPRERAPSWVQGMPADLVSKAYYMLKEGKAEEEVLQLLDDVGVRDPQAAMAALKKSSLRDMRVHTANAIANSTIAPSFMNGIRDLISDIVRPTEKGEFNFWHRTFGTQYHKATINSAFKKVFDLGQKFLDDIAMFAIRAEKMAPSIFPSMGQISLSAAGIKSLFKTGLSEKDNVLIGKALAEGTLVNGPNPHNGQIWTDAELISRYNMTPEQRQSYREARAAIDQSLDETAKALMAQIARTAKVPQAVVDSMLEQYLTMAQASAMLVNAMPPGTKSTLEATKQIKKIEGETSSLKAKGYAPLMRFGKYTVEVKDATDNTVFFSMHESPAERSRMERAVRADPKFANMKIAAGEMNEQQFLLFQGISPASMEAFVNAMPYNNAQQEAARQTYLRLAISNRSALSRMVKREGTAGYSLDATRTLAAFITSNARYGSKAVNGAPLFASVANIPKGSGNVASEATLLQQYLMNPREGAPRWRGFLFFQFLGGSIAAGLVNLTQPVLMTYPYLAQYGARRATAAMTAALRDTAQWLRSKRVSDPGLQAALKRAAERGVVEPQEIFQMMQAARTGTSSFLSAKFQRAWGVNFAVTEVFNRTITFSAAYRIGKSMPGTDPYEFAVKAVQDSQGLYNKANRPDWARETGALGTLGTVAFTFKQYSIAYVEFLKRLYGDGRIPKKSFLIAMGMLFLAAGAEGLPGSEDFDDIVETIWAWMGRPLNMKKEKRRFLRETLGMGETASDFTLQGISAFLPLDVQARLGMANLIPGTALFNPTRKDEAGSEALEVLGVTGSFAKTAGQAGEKLAKGEYWGAAKTVLPKALRDLVQANDMLTTGKMVDTKDRLTMAATPTDAVVKALGFNPRANADEQELVSMIMTDKKIVEAKKDEWHSRLAKAIAEDDTKTQDEVRAEREEWNTKYPEYKVDINWPAVNRRVQDMKRTRAERFVKAVPREIRQDTREKLLNRE